MSLINKQIEELRYHADNVKDIQAVTAFNKAADVIEMLSDKCKGNTLIACSCRQETDDKIQKAINRIHELGIEDVIVDQNGVFEEIKNESLLDIALYITDISNTIYDLRNILEGE